MRRVSVGGFAARGAHKGRVVLAGNLEVLGQACGHSPRGTAPAGFKAADGFTGTTDLLAEGFLRQVERATALLEPAAEGLARPACLPPWPDLRQVWVHG